MLCRIFPTSRPATLLCYFLAFSGSTAVAATLTDAQSLQDQAVARIDRFIDHFRRTFDRSSLRQELIQAERELQDSIRLFRRGGALESAGQSLVKLGDSRRYLDNWDSAIGAYQEAIQTTREVNAPAVVCKALLGHARALLYGKISPGQGLQLVEQALPIAKSLEDRNCLFDAWDLLAQIQIAQGDLIGAADSMNRAFSLENSIKDDKLLFYAYLDRADIYQKFAEKCDYQRNFKPCLDAIDGANRDYKAALAIAKKLRWDGLADQTEDFIQRLSIRKEMIHGQQRMHQLITDTDLFSPSDAGEVVISRQFTAGDNPQLVGLFAWLEKNGGLPPLTDARGAYIQGLMSEAAGMNDKALASYLRATDLLEHDRRQLYDERARGDYVEDKVEFYYTAILQLLDRKRYAEAFALMERSRSRVMADLIATKNMELSSTRERSLYADMLELRGNIAQHQACLFSLRSNKQKDQSCMAAVHAKPENTMSNRGVVQVGEPSSDSTLLIPELQAELEALQAQYSAVHNRMATETPRLAQLLTSKPVALNSLQKMLAQDGTELLTYLSLESQLIIWHIGPDSVQVRSVFLPRSKLKQKIERLRKSLIDPTTAYDKTTAHELYLYLITPVMDEIKSDRLVIVPHEDLHYLPFQALLTNLQNDFLGQRYLISYAPGATVLAALKSSGPLLGARLLAVADPDSLQHASQEVRAIAANYSGQIVDKQLPTKAEVKSWMPEKDLVHLAVHGSFVADEPLLSYLHLKPAGRENGRLTAAEMYGLPLDSAKLVVLSACETGSVRATHANEVIGMMRGLIFAGANALLLSAWMIDDEATAAWMETFYATMTTKAPAEAAQAAMTALQGNPKYRHPYYWSPFMLISR